MSLEQSWRLSFWKKLSCSGVHTKGTFIAVRCGHGGREFSTVGDESPHVINHAKEGAKLSV